MKKAIIVWGIAVCSYGAWVGVNDGVWQALVIAVLFMGLSFFTFLSLFAHGEAK